MGPQTYGQLLFDKAEENIQWNENSLFSKWCWENWTATCRRINLLIPLSYTMHKNKLMDEIPNHKTGNHQNPSGESGQQPLSPRPQQFLTQHISKARELKAKMSYWDLMKIKSF